MPSLGGSGRAGGDDPTGGASRSNGGMGSAGASGSGDYGIGMFGPMGLRGYNRVGNKISFSNPSSWTGAQQQSAKDAYSNSRTPQGSFNKFSAALLGYPTMPPFLDPKTVKTKSAVADYMGYMNAKRGILGRMSPTTPGVATDLGVSLLGGLTGALAPSSVTGGLSVAVNVVDNYNEDKKEAISKLTDAGYSMKDIEASFKDYEASLTEGLSGFGGGEGKNEYSDYEKALAEGLKAEQDGTEMSKTSTSQKSNTEEMRVARKKKTQRIFGGQLGSTDSGNQVKKAKLLGQ